MREAIIAIPTYRRPMGLEQLLRSLAELATVNSVRIIVADNDVLKREGLATVEKLLAQGYRWPIEAILVGERGISQVRNALIEASLRHPEASHVLMLDDDEIADPHWLDEMIRQQSLTGADIVGGRVNRLFAGQKPRWADAVPLLADKSRASTGPVEFVDSTANILFTRSILENPNGPVFDPAFALTGGGDKEALTRLKRRGASFAWAESAVISEQIPASRLTEDWVLRRAYRVGNSDMRVLLRHHTSQVEVWLEMLKAISVLLAAPALFLTALAGEARWMRSKLMMWRAAGKLAAVQGIAYREYHVTHGS
jgi:glycosyltransferase involved in cell wall biosynthesis